MDRGTTPATATPAGTTPATATPATATPAGSTSSAAASDEPVLERLGSLPARPRSLGWVPEAALVMGAIATVANAVQVLAAGPLSEFTWIASVTGLLVAAAIVRRRMPGHPLSGWFAVMGGLNPATQLFDTATAQLDPTSSPWVFLGLNLAGQLANTTTIVAALHLFGLFPNGEADRPWQRRVLGASWWLLAVPFVLAVAVPVVSLRWYSDTPPIPNPAHLLPVSLSLDAAQTIVGLVNATILVAIAMLVARHRRLGPADRRRVRWLLVPIVFTVLGTAAELVLRDSQQMLVNLLFIGIPFMVGVAIAMALLQPAGLDVDRVLRRSLTYGVLWLAITAAYVAAGAAIGVAAGQRLSVEMAVVMTVVATLVFQPARVGLERLADRWVFGTRTDPGRVIARLGDTLADTYDLDTLLPRMAATLERGLDVEWARVRLDGSAMPTGSDEADAHALAPGTPREGSHPTDEPALRAPIVLDDDHIGTVECGPRREGHLTEADRTVVTTFACQAALAVRNVRLATELSTQADELAASRSRLVRTQEQERRRIERNIHDGVQQDLVALISQAGRVHHLQLRDPTAATDELEFLQASLRRVLGDLRELARGIHPSLLADRGLIPAVEALAARNPVPVTIRADESLRTLRLAEEVEGAGYFTIAEALANSLKHADADHVDLTLSCQDGTLCIEVDDDGVGFDHARGDGSVGDRSAGDRTTSAAPNTTLVAGTNGGNGLVNMAERLEALGGTLEVTTARGAGTTVRATLAVAEPGRAGPGRAEPGRVR